ncbi:MAG: transglutaminase domain-containing protein, partial [Bacteroidota bacterium]
EILQDLDAFTYNIENGKVVATKVDKSSIFTEKQNDHWVFKKFTFPALKEGSIIEYSYQIKSDFFFNLHDWVFQGQYPVLWSQYDAAVPEFYRFITFTQGYQPFAVKKADSRQQSYSFSDRSMNDGGSTSKNDFNIDGRVDYNTWIMKDVPAIKPEAFTTTIRNSIGKIEFQLKEVAYPYQVVKPYMNTWEKAGQNLMENEHFGLLITRPNNWLDDQVAAIVKNASGNTEKTKKIYEYLRDNFTCTDHSGYYVTSNLKDVMKNKTGSVADINMLLIAMLRTQGIPAHPVLLSTRQHGYVNEIYPLMDKYNYMVAQVSAGDADYFLDASTPRLGFNKLPAATFNGQARVITKENALPVYFLADSLKEENTTMVFIENNSKGEVTGTVSSTLGHITSLAVRDGIAKSGMEEFKKKLKEDFTDDVELLDMKVDSLKKLEEPVAINYTVKLNSFGDADVIYFSPMFSEAIKK